MILFIIAFAVTSYSFYFTFFFLIFSCVVFFSAKKPRSCLEKVIFQYVSLPHAPKKLLCGLSIRIAVNIGEKLGDFIQTSVRGDHPFIFFSFFFDLLFFFLGSKKASNF